MGIPRNDSFSDDNLGENGDTDIKDGDEFEYVTDPSVGDISLDSIEADSFSGSDNEMVLPDNDSPRSHNSNSMK